MAVPLYPSSAFRDRYPLFVTYPARRYVFSYEACTHIFKAYANLVSSNTYVNHRLSIVVSQLVHTTTSYAEPAI